MKQYILGSVLCCTALTSGYAIAACTQTPDCETMGYIYTADECPNGGVKCPFDTSKYFCFDPSENESPSVPTSGYCCGYTDECGYNEISNSHDNECQTIYGQNCYETCKSYNIPDCPDIQNNCRTSGSTPVFLACTSPYTDHTVDFAAVFSCQ